MGETITKTLPNNRLLNDLIATEQLQGIVSTHKPVKVSDTEIRYESLPGNSIIGRADLYAEAGEWLAAIHSVKFQEAGILPKVLEGNGTTWNRFSRAIYNTDLEGLTEHPRERDMLREWLRSREVPERYRLLHVDYAPKNILGEDKLIAVIDFEYSCVGDPLYDLAWAAMTFGDIRPGMNWCREIVAAYNEIRTYPDLNQTLRTYKGSLLARILRVDVERMNTNWLDTLKREVWELTNE